MILNNSNATSVFVDSHRSVSNTVVNFSSVGAVDWNLLIVSSQSVSVSIRIGEESALEHLIEGRLDSWDQLAGRECRLLGLSKVIFNVSVED